MQTSGPTVKTSKLPAGVVAVGVVSFFNDIASEMVVPLVPILLTTSLAAGPLALGLIEGVADFVAALLKLWSGRLSDVLGGKRKPLTVAGYAVSNIARPLIALAGSWWHVLIFRSIDRVGKGLRTSPRDALIADLTEPEQRGRAFGLHRMFDNGGAFLGAVLASFLLGSVGLTPIQVVWVSVAAGAMALIVLIVAVREPAKPFIVGPMTELSWRTLSPRLRLYLGVLGVFALGRIPETFIMLLAHVRGWSPAKALALWAAYSLAKSLAAYAGGAMADHYGKRRLLLLSWFAQAGCLAFLAFADGGIPFIVAVLLFGVALGGGEGTERAVVSLFADATQLGTAFGWYNLLTGVVAVLAGALLGGLWQWFGQTTALATAAFITLIAACGVIALRPQAKS